MLDQATTATPLPCDDTSSRCAAGALFGDHCSSRPERQDPFLELYYLLTIRKMWRTRVRRKIANWECLSKSDLIAPSSDDASKALDEVRYNVFITRRKPLQSAKRILRG